MIGVSVADISKVPNKIGTDSTSHKIVRQSNIVWSAACPNVPNGIFRMVSCDR